MGGGHRCAGHFVMLGLESFPVPFSSVYRGAQISVYGGPKPRNQSNAVSRTALGEFAVDAKYPSAFLKFSVRGRPSLWRGQLPQRGHRKDDRVVSPLLEL